MLRRRYFAIGAVAEVNPLLYRHSTLLMKKSPLTRAEVAGSECCAGSAGIDGAISVLASVTAIIVAIELGYTAVFLLGAACYGLAAALLRLWPAARLAH